MRYEVVGNHPVGGVEPGGHVTVDDPTRARLLVRGGHLAPVATCGAATATGGPCSKKAGPDGFCHLHSEDD